MAERPHLAQTVKQFSYMISRFYSDGKIAIAHGKVMLSPANRRPYL